MEAASVATAAAPASPLSFLARFSLLLCYEWPHEYSSRKKDALNIQNVKKESVGGSLSTWLNKS
jgi:hypothetical protein